MYLLTHKLPRFALLHQNQVSFRLIFCRKCVSFAAGPINTQYNFPPILHFFHLLFYCELVLRVVFRGTRRATSRIPQRTSLIMTSQNVILITFNFFFIFLGAGLIFTANRELQNYVFHTHTCANIVFLQIKFTKFYFHYCAQKVRFYCARVPLIFGFSRTYSTNMKSVKIRVSDKGKILFSNRYLTARVQHFRKIVSKNINLKQWN